MSLDDVSPSVVESLEPDTSVDATVVDFLRSNGSLTFSTVVMCGSRVVVLSVEFSSPVAIDSSVVDPRSKVVEPSTSDELDPEASVSSDSVEIVGSEPDPDSDVNSDSSSVNDVDPVPDPSSGVK